MQAAVPADVGELIYEVDEGDIGRVRELLSGGSIDVNAADEDWTALQSAAAQAEGGRLEIINMLLGAGADINKARDNGCTPLYIASQQGKLEVVKVLIEAKAKVDQAMEDGATPLFIASEHGELEVVKVLIEAKAKVDQAEQNGSTPLYIASQLGKLEVVKALIEGKAKVNQADDIGATPLYISSQEGKLEVVTTLIEAGAAINQARNDGRPPIYIASCNGHAPIVQVLIDAGARTAELMYKGTMSPLHVAAAKGNLECVKLLTGFRPDMPGWTTFLAGATSKKELEAYKSPPANRPPTFLPKIFDRAYLELIWKFQQERYSDLHLKNGQDGLTALEIADHYKKTDVAKLLRGMMVLPNEGKAAGEKKAATKGGK